MPIFNDFLAGVFVDKTAQSYELTLLPVDRSPTFIIQFEAIANDDDQSCRVILINALRNAQGDSDRISSLPLMLLFRQAPLSGDELMLANFAGARNLCVGVQTLPGI